MFFAFFCGKYEPSLSEVWRFSAKPRSGQTFTISKRHGGIFARKKRGRPSPAGHCRIVILQNIQKYFFCPADFLHDLHASRGIADFLHDLKKKVLEPL
jgi:hypothetical protein